MSETTVQHATTVVERSFKSSPWMVYAAWADPEAQAKWNLPGDDWMTSKSINDFKVGGRLMSRFGPKDDAKYMSEGLYFDIVPNSRIISAGAMHFGEARSSVTLCTVEFIADGEGTKLILTDQSAFFLDQGEKPSDRKTGWGQIFDRLAKYLEQSANA